MVINYRTIHWYYSSVRIPCLCGIMGGNETRDPYGGHTLYVDTQMPHTTHLSQVFPKEAADITFHWQHRLGIYSHNQSFKCKIYIVESYMLISFFFSSCWSGNVGTLSQSCHTILLLCLNIPWCDVPIFQVPYKEAYQHYQVPGIIICISYVILKSLKC